MKQGNANLSVGTPWKILLAYTLPMLGSAVFQQIYTIADTVIAGKFAGESALAAVGASMSIVNILMAVALGANAGCAVLAARYFGAKDTRRTLSCILSSFVGFFTLSVVLMGAGFLSSGPVLSALRTPDSVMKESVLYLNIYIAGLPSLILYNLATGIYSALGDSKTPFFFLVSSSLANILLDYIFTAVCKWGVSGVAWATFITQTAACILTLICLLFRLKKMHAAYKREEETAYKKPSFSWGLLGAVCVAALPVVLQNGFVSLGNLFIQSIINGYGESAMAGFTAGFKILIFCTTCICTLGTGLTNYASQNLGAGEIKRIKTGFLSELVISSAVSMALFALVFLFSGTLVGLFLEDGGSAALDYGKLFVKIVSPFFIVVNLKVAADCTVRGCGGNLGFMVSTFADLILRVAFAFILSPVLGMQGVFWSWPIGWGIGTVIALLFYFNIPILKKFRKQSSAA